MNVIKCYREEELIMKKIVKFMGITAATLLAVAPIAAPVLSTTSVSAATDVDGNFIQPDASYTDNGDGTYTLHGTLNGDIWSGGDKSHPTGNALPISLEGMKADSEGIITLKAPTFDGYTYGSNDTYQLDLDGEGNVYLYSGFNYEPTNSTTAEQNKTFGVPYSTTITLTTDAITCDDTGLPNQVTGTRDFSELPAGSSWKVDRKMFMYGETYYRVGNNVWVDKRDGTEQAANPNVVTTKNQASLYTKDGKKVTNRALAANTPWYTDQSATINGEKMYRVATNEWVKASDIQ